MKKRMLFLLLLSSVFVNAQSLKEALYGGKLKNDPGTVIRKGDDLTTKMADTTRKAPGNTTANATFPASDSSLRKVPGQTDSVTIAQGVTDNVSHSTDTASLAGKEPNELIATKDPAASTRENNAVLKAFMDTIIGTLKTEVLPSKKIKDGSYYVLVSYSIGTDGQLAIGDVFLSPENAFLQQQIKDRLVLDTPRLNPVLSSTGTPRKVNRKYNFTLVKE